MYISILELFLVLICTSTATLVLGHMSWRRELLYKSKTRAGIMIKGRLFHIVTEEEFCKDILKLHPGEY